MRIKIIFLAAFFAGLLPAAPASAGTPLAEILKQISVSTTTAGARNTPFYKLSRNKTKPQAAPRRVGAGPSYPATLVLGEMDFTTSLLAGPAVSSTTLKSPFAVATGGGRVYVADTDNNRVLWWNSSTAYTTGRGADGVLGQPDLTNRSGNRGGAAAANTLNAPKGVAVDASSNVWVTDSANNRVLRFPAPAAGADTSANLVLGQTNFTDTSANGVGTPAAGTLSYPQGIAIDVSSNVWVTDYFNNRVLEYTYAAISLGFTPGSAIPAGAVLGQPDLTSDGNGLTDSSLNQPTGVAVDDAGDVWVADFSNRRVLRFPSGAAPADVVLGQTGFTSNAAATTQDGLSKPVGVAVKADGTEVWVGDYGNNRVLRYTTPATGAPADLVLGQADYTSGGSNGGAAGSAVLMNAAGLNSPEGIFLDPAGNVWVADTVNNRVVEFASPSADGENAVLALGRNSLAIDPATLLARPAGIVEGGGRVYISDSFYNRVLWWDSAAAYTNDRPADGVIGQHDFNSFAANRGAGTNYDAFDGPAGLAVDSSSNVWVVDNFNNRVLRFPEPGLGSDPSADLVLGQGDFTSAGSGTTQNSLNLPTGLAMDASGNVWVADSGNNRVLEYSAATIAAYLPGGALDADLVLGQNDFNSGGSGTTAAALDSPAGVKVGVAGDVWVADTYNNRVLKYSSSAIAGYSPGTAPLASLVLGQADFLSSGSGVTAASFDTPGFITLDLSGNLWVPDMSNNRVLEFKAAALAGGFIPGHALSAGLVLGQGDFTSNDSGLSATALKQPSGVTVNASGNVWVMDTFNGRALRYPFGLASISGAVAKTGGTLGGVTLNLTGPLAASVTSAPDGTFSFDNLPDGLYIATPFLADYTFTPASRVVNVTGGRVSGQDFAATYTAAAPVSNKPSIYASGGPNGYAEPRKGYNAAINLSSPAQSGHVTVKIYTQRNARLVKTLGADVTAGTATAIAWDCLNTDGELAGSGVYVAVVNGAGYDNEKVRIGVLK